MIYVARADGVLEVWDLLDRSHEPSMTAAPCTTPITYLSFSPAGAPAVSGGRSVQQLLAIGAPPCHSCFSICILGAHSLQMDASLHVHYLMNSV